MSEPKVGSQAMSEPREQMWTEVFEAVGNPFVDCDHALSLLRAAHAADTARIAALEAENRKLAEAAYALASWAQSSDRENTPEFLDGLQQRIGAIDALLMRECDQCGWKPWDGWISWQCGSHPFGSCDGKLMVVARSAAPAVSSPEEP